MSQSLAAMTKVVFCHRSQNAGNGNENNYYTGEEFWNYCHNRLKLLASLIDDACFFSERNRRSFCEGDPFSFQDRKRGLIFHILIFLHHCGVCDLGQLDQKRSQTMTLALRTLTSLTHDNPLAAEQMKLSDDYGIHLDNGCRDSMDNSIQGIHILANLVFQLEESPSPSSVEAKRASLASSKKAKEHDMYRYDGTIFCLTTLANVTEGTGIVRMLMELKIVLHSGKKLLWLEWLCQWLVKQTDTFRQEILSIGTTKSLKSDSTGTATSESENQGLHQHEEDKLVAAGNGCVVLACLITEPDDGDPESSIIVRNLIKDQMPLDSDGSSSGLSLIANTLKAYCNYYHMSMGQMSGAVVGPVRKLIDELDQIIRVDEDHSSQ